MIWLSGSLNSLARPYGVRYVRMDVYTFALGTLVLVAVYTLALSGVRAYAKVRREEIAAEVQVKVAQVEAQQKVQHAMKILANKGVESRRRKKRDDDEDDADEEPEDDEPTMIERAAIQFAAGVGIDLPRLVAGDQSEMQKAQLVMAKIKGSSGNGAGDL